MVMKVTVFAPSADVMNKAKQLLERPRPPVVRDPRTGTRRVALENLDGTHVYYVDPDGRQCSCEAGQNGTMCHHRLAVAEWANHDALAAWVDEQEQAAPPKSRPTIEELWPSCWTAGCGNDPEPHSGGCHEHTNSEAF